MGGEFRPTTARVAWSPVVFPKQKITILAPVSELILRIVA